MNRLLVACCLLLLPACTSDQGARPSPLPPSPSPPRIGELVGVRGEPIDVDSLQGRIAFSSGAEDVYTMNADGSELTRLTSSTALEFDPTWSPDGRAIAYRHQTGDDTTSEIFVMGADGTNRRNLTGRDGLPDWGPDWSPDGEWIAWNAAPEEGGFGFDLGLIHPDGTGHRVIRPGEFVEYPAWSPDGRRIAFMGQVPEEGSQYDIFVMDADGTDVERLTDSPADDGWPDWSPDGRRIVFTTVRDDCLYSDQDDCLTTGDSGQWHTLYVMDADGSHLHRLTRTFGQFATWSPEGRHILFAPELNVIRADGTGLTRISPEDLPPEPLFPDWIGP